MTELSGEMGGDANEKVGMGGKKLECEEERKEGWQWERKEIEVDEEAR